MDPRADRTQSKWSTTRLATIAALLVALGLWTGWSKAGHAGAAVAPPAVAAQADEPHRLDARRSARSGSRTCVLQVAVVDPANPGSSAAATSWIGQFERNGVAGATETVTHLASLVQGEPGDRCEWIVLEVNGQLARPIRPWFVLGEDANAIVQVELLWDGEVRVVDAVDGLDLPAVEVVLAQGEEGQFLLPPRQGSIRAHANRAASPVTMPAARGRATYWLGAPGHAWRRITYSGAEGGTPVHALVEGCSLSVRRNADAGEHTQVRVSLIRPAGGGAEERYATTDLPEGADVAFAGLPAGDVLARFSVRAGDTPEVVIHEAHVSLAAGQAHGLELDLLRHWTPTGFAALELQLDVTAESDLEAYELTLVPVELQAPVPLRKRLASLEEQAQGLRVWNVERLLPGRYRLAVAPGGSSAEFELAAGESQLLELALDPAPTLRLWCIDASNGAPVQPQLVLHRPASSGTAEAWREAPLRWEEGAAHVRTEAGEIELGVRAPGFLTARALVPVKQGTNDAIVELAPAQSIDLRVSLTCEGAEVPISADAWTRLRLLDAEGRDSIQSLRLGTGTGEAGCCREAAVATFVVGAPGVYDLHLDPPPPLRGPVVRSVQLGASGAELAIELERPAEVGR